nr:MAG TPA: hypothetical protein [Caudoviricetes sp.]
MKMQMFENIKSETKNKKRKSGDAVISVAGNVISYGFYVRLNAEKTQINVSYIIAEDWEELKNVICDHFDLIDEDLPEATMRKIFERVAVFAESETFKATGKEYFIKR